MVSSFSAIAFISLMAGLLQGITGFGSGILQMLVLPWFFPLNEAAGISGVVCCALTAVLLFRYRQHVKPRKLIWPIVFYTIGSYSSISFSTLVDQALMKRLLGAFLIVLAVHFLFVRKKDMERVSELTAAIFSVISGVCDGLFSIGGPLMVILFLARSDSREEYLANTQFHFFVTLLINCIVRAYKGIIGAVHLPYMLLGIVMVGIGGLLAGRVAGKVDGERLRRIVYWCVGFSGLVNLIGL